MKDARLLRTELVISYVLRYGVLLCLFVIGVGLAGRMLAPGAEEVVTALLHGQTLGDYHPPTSLAAVWAGVSIFNPDTVIAFGLILLIALPILRVALTCALFLRDRDWPFVGITMVVLTILLSGILLGRAL